MNPVLHFVSTLLFFILIIVSETKAANSQGNSFYSGQFTYRGNISYFDQSLLISELAPGNTDISLRYCAAECHSNLDCNAVEMCSSARGNTCRLSRKVATSLTTGKNTCSRYELEHTCEVDSYFNRRENTCQCAIDCGCDAVTPSSGVVMNSTLKLDDDKFTVNCMNSNGYVWTMIQRRFDGSVNFYRGWTDYQRGFGDLNSEFWLGLDNIRLLVENGYTVLRVELEDSMESVYAEYSSFNIAGEDDNYRILVFGYTGTAGDGIFCCHNFGEFSTYDNDNDMVPLVNAAQKYKGAWWYYLAHASNLNGEYGNNKLGEGINWFPFKGSLNSLSASRMMLRRA